MTRQDDAETSRDAGARHGVAFDPVVSRLSMPERMRRETAICASEDALEEQKRAYLRDCGWTQRPGRGRKALWAHWDCATEVPTESAIEAEALITLSRMAALDFEPLVRLSGGRLIGPSDVPPAQKEHAGLVAAGALELLAQRLSDAGQIYGAICVRRMAQEAKHWGATPDAAV